MNRIVTDLAIVLAGLVLLVNSTPSWGQSIVNPTVSDANRNTAGGTGALPNVVSGEDGGFNNTAFGFHALFTNTTGTGNTATGRGALEANTIGGSNTATGEDALFTNDIGNSNTAHGTDALFSNTSGSFNTAIGAEALALNDTGNQNTAIGFQALQFNTGNKNTATGDDALVQNTTGHHNTASGFAALSTNTTGSKNTAFGTQALSLSTGTKNIGIGYQAGSALTSGSHNIYIGNAGASSESQTIRLGTTQTVTFIAGIATQLVIGLPVNIDTTTGQLGVNPSSARYKRDIAAMGTRSEGLLQLRPVTFAYKDDAQGMTHYGLIAEDVAAVYPELVTHTPTGEVQAVRYQELIPMLLNELQRQRQEFQQELADLRALVGQGRGAQAIIPSPTIAVGETGSVQQ